MRSSGSLLVVVCIEFVFGSSLTKRLHERKEDEGWISTRDVLMGIRDKLRSLDTFNLKLARLDFSLEQEVRKMESIESKLGRLETKFDVRFEKAEQVVDISNEHLSRRVEALNEKINNKAAYLDAKLDIKLERIVSKLELLERDLHNSVDDILERLVKGEEKCSYVENEVTKHDEKLEHVSIQLRDLTSFAKVDLKNLIHENSESLRAEVSNVEELMLAQKNTSEHILSGIRANVTSTKEGVIMLLQDTNNKIENLSVAVRMNERGAVDLCELNSQEQIENLTTALENALSIGEAKLKELDADVEQYTKKVINGIQELWKTSEGLKVDLSLTLEQGSKTREIVRREFQRLHEQIEPLPKLEPKLTDISEDLDKKVVELSTTVDNSFATLLVAQNTFIDSCKRIQREEMHVYDILQQIIYEMRNRSLLDIQRISSELRLQNIQMNESMSRVLTAVLLIGNMTREAVQTQKCGGKMCSNSVQSLKQNHSILYDNESDPINDSDYEDYQLSEAYYPGNI